MKAKYRVTQEAFILLSNRKVGDILELYPHEYIRYKKVVEAVSANHTSHCEPTQSDGVAIQKEKIGNTFFMICKALVYKEIEKCI
jgi:hypothetical protein